MSPIVDVPFPLVLGHDSQATAGPHVSEALTEREMLTHHQLRSGQSGLCLDSKHL